MTTKTLPLNMHIGGENGTRDGTTPLTEQTTESKLRSIEARTAKLLTLVRQLQNGAQVTGERYQTCQDIMVFAAGIGLCERPETIFPGSPSDGDRHSPIHAVRDRASRRAGRQGKEAGRGARPGKSRGS